jgi:hypothetical protein
MNGPLYADDLQPRFIRKEVPRVLEEFDKRFK